jgi:hypothetical protein
VIAIVLSMIRARRAQAVTLFLLAAVAVAAAVAGPVSNRATDAALVRLEVANATDRERSISVIAFSDPTDPQASAQFDVLSQLVALPGFEAVRSGETQVFGPVADPDDVLTVTGTRAVFRDRVCEHVTVLSGRCLAGTQEILIGERAAEQNGLAPGDVATLQASRVSDQGTLIPDGAPATLTVVGVYRPIDMTEPYWSGQQYFSVNEDGARDEAVFMTAATMTLLEHTSGVSYLDAFAEASLFTTPRLEGIGAEVIAATAPLSNIENLVVSTELPALAERVATNRELANQLGPVAFIPLVALSLFVIYLAVGYGVFGRRTELGLVALRGVGGSRRWLLAGGEAVIPILIGAPVGYVLGHLGIGLVARLRLGSGDGAQLSLESLPFAGVALAVAVGVALLGQRRALREPVVELLRGVQRGASAWQALMVEALIGALAVLATVQLRVSAPDGITGLGLLVPGLLIAAVALVAARVNVVVTGLVARLALRRGLLGAGLSAVQLARRPGSHRLFVLLAVGSAILAFVAAGTDVAGRAREVRATVATGADRVLTLVNADARQLLAATRTADPEGEWAMAAITVPPENTQEPSLLAVDAQRLAAVATWRPEFGAEPTAVAAALAPPSPGDADYVAPLEFRGTRIEVDAEVVVQRPGGFNPPPFVPLALDVNFAPLDGGRQVRAVLSSLV